MLVGNILVTGKGECKLADFGVSGTLSERTRKRNTVIGTPFFLAPEVIQEVGYDSKADVRSACKVKDLIRFIDLGSRYYSNRNGRTKPPLL